MLNSPFPSTSRRRMSLLLPLTALALGLIIGSFLNVVIHRYPRAENIVFPPSHCPHCNANIRPYDNVPVLSYLWLRGRCRACGERIALRYPLVELANGLFYLAIWQRTGPTLGFVAIAAIVSMILVLIYIHLDIQILPDVIDLPGLATGLAIGAAPMCAAPIASPIESPGRSMTSGRIWMSRSM